MLNKQNKNGNGQSVIKYLRK